MLHEYFHLVFFLGYVVITSADLAFMGKEDKILCDIGIARKMVIEEIHN